MKAREEKTTRTGKKPGGKPPTPPSPDVRPTDQINLTDADSRIMPATGKGFEQSYNAQAAVDSESMLVVATSMAQVATDKQQVEPMLEALADLPEALGSVEHLLTDNGYFSAANVERCVEAKIEPLLAAGRDGHHPHWEDRFTEPPDLVEPASAMERMKHRLKAASTSTRSRAVSPCVRLRKPCTIAGRKANFAIRDVDFPMPVHRLFEEPLYLVGLSAYRKTLALWCRSAY